MQTACLQLYERHVSKYYMHCILIINTIYLIDIYVCLAKEARAYGRFLGVSFECQKIPQ